MPRSSSPPPPSVPRRDSADGGGLLFGSEPITSMMSQLKMSSCSASGRLSGTSSLLCVRSFFVRSPRMLGLGAVGGGGGGEAAWAGEGESCKMCREVEKGRMDDGGG